MSLAYLLTYLIVLVLPGFLIVNLLPRSRYNVFVKLLLLPLFGTSVSVVIVSVVSMAGVPLNKPVVITLYLIVALVALSPAVKVVRSYPKLVDDLRAVLNRPRIISSAKENLPLILLCALVLLGLAAKLLPELSVLAPPLHDPAAHALYAKSIIQSGHIEYFYSAGLHILVAVSTIIGGLSIPKSLLYLTNFFNAYIGVGVFFFIYKIFRRPWWAIFAAAMAIFGYYPTLFYTGAGKNALVVALAILPVAMLMADEIYARSDWPLQEKGVVLTVLLAGVVLTHYPSVYMYASFLAAILIVGHSFQPDAEKQSLKSTLVLLAQTHLPAVLIGAAWFASHYSYYLSFAREMSVQRAGSSLFLDGTMAISNARGMIAAIANSDKSPFLMLTTAGIVGWTIIAARSDERPFAVWPVLFFLGLMILAFTGAPWLDSVKETALLSAFMLVIIGASALSAALVEILAKKWPRVVKPAMAVLLLTAALGQSVMIYHRYVVVDSEYSLVTKDDVRAMNWIEANLPEQGIILNNTKKVGDWIFGTDAGHWIPVYTDNRVAMPFTEKNTKNVLVYYGLLEDLERDPADPVAKRKLVDIGIKYIYIGAKNPYHAGLTVSALNKAGYERLYDGKASVFSIE